MAIKITLSGTESRLFCCSKWWGDPDMPVDMPYPMMKDTDGEEYPLTFICQVDCADIAELDAGGPLPEEGMLYFFAALDEYLGYEAPCHNGPGEWPKGTVLVKYAKHVNPETFESYIMVDDEDEPLALPAMKMEFSQCGDEDACTRLLGACGDFAGLLHVDAADAHISGLGFPEGHSFDIAIGRDDLKFGNWKRAKGYLSC
ncbi:MAG: YwqG family protein [Bacteroides sp.]|nr:YwqG family protein [Bacteroides sp.]